MSADPWIGQTFPFHPLLDHQPHKTAESAEVLEEQDYEMAETEADTIRLQEAEARLALKMPSVDFNSQPEDLQAKMLELPG